MQASVKDVVGSDWAHFSLHEPQGRQNCPLVGGEAFKKRRRCPLSSDERQVRRKAAEGKGRVAVTATQLFGRFAEGADEGGIDLIERLLDRLQNGFQ